MTMAHFLADDGEPIHVKVSGDGPPLVLLHGWTASHQEWFPFLGALGAQHRVYRWDARAHGGHPLRTQTRPSVQRMARDLANLLDHYKLDQVVAVGHSMGALTLWQYIRDFGTDRLRKLCLIDQSPRLLTDDDWRHGIYGDFDRARSQQFLGELRDDFAEAVLRLGALGLNQRAREKYLQNAQGWVKARTQLQAQAAAPLIDCWHSLTEADYRDVLERIDIPTLLVYGGASNFYHGETARYVARTIPEALLSVYEDCDHSPHQWQRERFVRELIAFAA